MQQLCPTITTFCTNYIKQNLSNGINVNIFSISVFELVLKYHFFYRHPSHFSFLPYANTRFFCGLWNTSTILCSFYNKSNYQNKKKKKKYGKPRKLCYRQCTALLSQICQVKQGILHKPFQKYLLNLQSSVSLVYHDCFSPYCLAFLLDKKAWFMPLTSRTSIMIARKLSLIKVIPSCSEYAVSSQ